MQIWVSVQTEVYTQILWAPCEQPFEKLLALCRSDVHESRSSYILAKLTSATQNSISFPDFSGFDDTVHLDVNLKI